jgi:transketolase
MQDKQTIKNVKLLAAQIRRGVVMMVGGKGQVGHIGGSCSSADLVAALYGAKMKHDSKNPGWEGRDKFLYSKGHAAIAQYAALAQCGYLPVEELATCKVLGSRLQGHPDRTKTPGIEAGTGSLGQGLSIANGLALAMRLDGKPNKVYCLMGDGEMAEGQIWEAAMTSAAYKLDNVVGILDRNRLQAMGPVTDRFDSGDMKSKWESFGWNVIEIDGHDVEAILDAYDKADTVKGVPTLILANTIKGRGISFAENVVAFHNGSFTPEQYEQAIGELDAAIAALA